VRAVTDCTVLEMFDDMLFEEMRQSKPFRELIDRKYRERALNHQLRSVPIFAGLSNEFINQHLDKAKLQRFNPGEAFVKQGEVADSFYIIRLGSVRVSQGQLGGELGITYLGKGEYFGEIGLLGEGRRTATCTALDHVEVVRIDAAEFQQMLEAFPATRKEFEALVRARLLASRHDERPVRVGSAGSASPACWSSSRRSPQRSAHRCRRPRPRAPSHPSPSTVLRLASHCPRACGRHMARPRSSRQDGRGSTPVRASTRPGHTRAPGPSRRLGGVPAGAIPGGPGRE